jgi:endonuclease/exonuclease/phosphatase family metal-dependent hydrolase
MKIPVLGLWLLVGAGEACAISVATWNMEWLVAPRSAHEARQQCQAGQRSRLPCDVALGLARSSSDFAALRRVAGRIDADVVAVQEVENAEVLARVFPGHGICLTQGPGMQQVGFVVAPGVGFRCLPDHAPLGLDGRLRPGAQMLWLPEGRQPIHLLALHLKSGCAEGPRDPARQACRQQAMQWPIVQAWIDQHRRERHDYVILGDFNRIEPLPVDVAPVPRLGRQPCRIGQPHARPIDHILLSTGLRAAPQGAHMIGFSPREATRNQLSDHCPVRVDILGPTGSPPGS